MDVYDEVDRRETDAGKGSLFSLNPKASHPQCLLFDAVDKTNRLAINDCVCFLILYYILN